MRDEKSVTVALIELASAVLVVAVTAYCYDDDVKDLVDSAVRELRFRIRKAHWLAWWNRQPGWRRELYEQKHGPQEV